MDLRWFEFLSCQPDVDLSIKYNSSNYYIDTNIHEQEFNGLIKTLDFKSQSAIDALIESFNKSISCKTLAWKNKEGKWISVKMPVIRI